MARVDLQRMDWHYTMLDIAVEITKNDKEAKQIHSLLEEIKPKKPTGTGTCKRLNVSGLTLSVNRR